MSAESSRPGRIQIWVMASRPKTLGAAFAPVLIGTVLAYGDGKLHALSAACALLGALLIQIGTNFANDYFDFVKGTDTEKRVGPTRVTQAGLVSPATMKRAMTIVFALVFVPGAYIMYRGGWPLFAIGVISIALGVLYTGGPFPLGYLGLGDILVLIFFGPIAVGGTYYIQALDLNRDVIVAGFAPGLISVGLLTINNLRDIDGDAKSGKRTLAVRFGREFAKFEYVAAMVGSCFVVPLYFYSVSSQRLWAALAIVASLAAKKPIMTVLNEVDPARLNLALARTGMLLPLFAIGFAICILL
jgi:1,4-dihydroxy-2-naphthoate octaprenyltransferase